MKNLKIYFYIEFFFEGKYLLNCIYMENIVILIILMKKWE